MLYKGNKGTRPLFFMTKNSDLWLRVTTNTELLDAVEHSNIKVVAAMTTLRKSWCMEEITIAASLCEARKRASGKIENARDIVSDSIGVQQATSTHIAKHKAKRFATEGPVFDLCCGIGSDLRALPTQTVGVDIDPLRCWMAVQNSGKKTITQDVTHLDVPANALVHIDPSRRSGTKRLHALDAMQPTIYELSDLVSKCAGGCIKVSPSVNVEDVENFPEPFELEYIEENGRVLQGVIWFGSLALHVNQVTATSMTLNESVSGVPDIPTFNPEPSGWLLEPNPALERSGLHCNVAIAAKAQELAPNLGLFCSITEINSPWFQHFEILAMTPLRIEKVKRILAELNCTQVEVKTRGKTIDPNQWQKDLSSKSEGELLTVFALRLGKKRVAILTRRYGAP
jgi:hypothetical protein